MKTLALSAQSKGGLTMNEWVHAFAWFAIGFGVATLCLVLSSLIEVKVRLK